MDKPKATPKDFFLWAGAMIALYAGVSSFIGLLFDYINYAFPDPSLVYYGYNPYQGSVSYEMASLIVLAPLLLILMRVIRAGIQADPTRREIWVRRWALFLVLFVAGASIVVDLIVLINTFLQGEELSVRFLLKVVIVLLVASAGFLHFISDLFGYWEKKPEYAKMVSWAVAALVVLTIASGFVIIGSPQTQRQYRLDEQRLGDLQQIQSQIVYYYQQKTVLPAQLSDLDDSVSYFTIPNDPESNQPYGYTKKAGLNFELCATFSQPSQLGPKDMQPVYSDLPAPEKWQHGAGKTCFLRTIDPQLYPQVKNPQ